MAPTASHHQTYGRAGRKRSYHKPDGKFVVRRRKKIRIAAECPQTVCNDSRHASGKVGTKRKRCRKVGGPLNSQEQAEIPAESTESNTSNVTASAMVEKIIEHHRCPITHQIVVDPVVAEDGHIYERRAIEKWFLTKQRSPVTNASMGCRLTESVPSRQLVADLLDGNMLDTDTTIQFLLTRGRLRATRLGVLGPDLDGAQADLIRAKKLLESSSASDSLELQLSTVTWMQEGQKLSKLAKESQSDESKNFMIDVGFAVRRLICGMHEQRMSEWRVVPKGTRFRVIDDVAELQRLCERPAPGAEGKVNWNPEMREFAGQECILQDMGEESHMNYVLRLRRAGQRRSRSFSFPFDALVLVELGEERQERLRVGQA